MYSCLIPVDSCHGATIVTSDCTIVTEGHHCSIRTTFISNNSTIWKKQGYYPRKLATGGIHEYIILLLPTNVYSIWGTENCKQNNVPSSDESPHSIVSSCAQLNVMHPPEVQKKNNFFFEESTWCPPPHVISDAEITAR